jgi:GNAT superfamily N-acetyltransferase
MYLQRRFRLIDLRQLPARSLEPLFAEEQRQWLEVLLWDYRPAVETLRRFLDTRTLSGYAVFEGHAPAGYGFYVVEEHKGLLGDLFVSTRYPHDEVAAPLLCELVRALRSLAGVERIEAQLIPFGGSHDKAFAALGFRLFPRQFMLRPLTEASPPPDFGAVRIEPWNERWFVPCARLIQSAYAGHVDSQINEQYRTAGGALKFLRNLILLPGCGRFLPDVSFVVPAPGGEALLAAVLNSEVSPQVAHTTQLAVRADCQRRGLGRRLLQATMAALQARRFRALTLTVSAENRPAVELYQRLGFRTVKTFSAAVWQAREEAGGIGSGGP